MPDETQHGYCNGCNDYDEMNSYGYCESCHCSGCVEDSRTDYDYEDDYSESGYINDYSYRPDPTFHNGSDARRDISYVPADGTPYLGLELEITTGNRDRDAETVTDAQPGLIYCKEDSSVRGFEMVTMPATLAAHKALLPFDELTELAQAGATAHQNGIHVHVSRDGFDSDLHAFRWAKLIYRNAPDVIRHARRDSSEWAAFRPEDSAELVRTAKKDARKARPRGYANRYSAINVTNRETFEVRVFQGSLDRSEILAALELVAGTVEYTRTLTLADIRNDAGWTWAAFIRWASRQGETYGNLVRLDIATTPAPEQLTFREVWPPLYVGERYRTEMVADDALAAILDGSPVTSDSWTETDRCECDGCTEYRREMDQMEADRAEASFLDGLQTVETFTVPAIDRTYSGPECGNEDCQICPTIYQDRNGDRVTAEDYADANPF